MEKVIIKQNDVEVYKGSLSGGSVFLGKHPLYLSHINQGFRKLPFKIPYEIYIDGNQLEKSEEVIAKDFNAPVKVGVKITVNSAEFEVLEIIELPFNNYMIIVSDGNEKFGFTSDRIITLNSLYTRIQRLMR